MGPSQLIGLSDIVPQVSHKSKSTHGRQTLRRSDARAHDMVCTAKGIDVILLLEVRGARSTPPAIWRGMRKWARMPQKFGWNFTLVWARWLGNSRMNFTPTAFLEAPSSRTWKPSPVRWATR